MRLIRSIILLAIASSVAVIFAVSFHSVGEIHYLKTFYPERFTVKEAFYAAWVEFIKVHLISLPFVLLILLCLYLLWYLRGDGRDG